MIICSNLAISFHYLLSTVPTDGGWGNWMPWGACSATCGSGNQTRSRDCDKPAPSNGGKPCNESNTDIRICAMADCSTVPCRLKLNTMFTVFSIIKDSFGFQCHHRWKINFATKKQSFKLQYFSKIYIHFLS